MTTLRKSDLSRAWRALVDRCQRLNFGHLEEVLFVDGEPMGCARVVKTFKPGPGTNNGYADGAGRVDVALREQWRDVLVLAQTTEHLVVRRFEVAHGNPLKLLVGEDGHDFCA
jgi:hypothetical protein